MVQLRPQILRRLWPRIALRKIAAAVLALAVLAAFAPFSSYSHAHNCSMPCCASGSCSTGACDVSFEKAAATPEPESHCEHAEHAMTVRVESFIEEDSTGHDELTELCGAADLNRLSATPLSQAVPLHETSLKAAAFSRPCGMDCCAGVGAFSQLRRSRELSLLNNQSKPQSPSFLSFSNQESSPLFLQTQWRRQAKPRAPPPVSSDFIS
ncbi:MAG: hypothetical protein JOZ52_01950 [Acidobacteria bacterium]|nr:hypothetical protein [Acidobacteriota bacterium]